MPSRRDKEKTDKKHTIATLYYTLWPKADCVLRVRVTRPILEAFKMLYRRVRDIKLERREISAPRYYRQTEFMEEMLELIAQKYGLEEVLYQVGLKKKRVDEGSAY